MRRRSIRKFGPGLEQFEEKQLLSALFAHGPPGGHKHRHTVLGPAIGRNPTTQDRRA